MEVARAAVRLPARNVASNLTTPPDTVVNLGTERTAKHIEESAQLHQLAEARPWSQSRYSEASTMITGVPPEATDDEGGQDRDLILVQHWDPELGMRSSRPV